MLCVLNSHFSATEILLSLLLSVEARSRISYSHAIPILRSRIPLDTFRNIEGIEPRNKEEKEVVEEKGLFRNSWPIIYTGERERERGGPQQGLRHDKIGSSGASTRIQSNTG